MANLVIDIGNTFTKLAVFNREQMVYVEQHQSAGIQIIDNLLNSYQLHKSIISSVKSGMEEWNTYLQNKVPLFYFNYHMAKGIANHYRSPETLGPDRLAAVVGAKSLYPDVDSLIIGGGTCITYDWVSHTGNYFGGSISPGVNMRYKALNYYTAGLPLIEADMHFENAFGDDTYSSLRSGVQNGIKYELEGFINSYTLKGNVPNIILCGGDSIFFETLLKNSIFAPYIKIEPYLVLKGLNAAILNNND